MVDTLVSGASASRRVGSTPIIRTISLNKPAQTGRLSALYCLSSRRPYAYAFYGFTIGGAMLFDWIKKRLLLGKMCQNRV